MRILYVFPFAMERDLQRVARGDAPSEWMYGLVELRRRGHDVTIADSRFEGRTGDMVRRLRRVSINVCDLRTLDSIRRHDVVLVKDQFSTLVTAACRALQKPVYYLDAPFNLPRRAWKHAVYRANLRLITKHLLFSVSQADLWAARYGVPRHRFLALPYSVDLGFYRPAPRPATSGRPYVVSVGRDLGRSFRTLVDALDGLGVGLKIVTRPYLLKDVRRPHWVEVLDDLPYPELFRLYAGAAAAVVPLVHGITYPAGLRALLEAMALGTPVVASHTPVLLEYASDGDGVVYVEPEDAAALRAGIRRVMEEAGLRDRLSTAGRALVASRYGMEAFGERLERVLLGHAAPPEGGAAHSAAGQVTAAGAAGPAHQPNRAPGL